MQSQDLGEQATPASTDRTKVLLVLVAVLLAVAVAVLATVLALRGGDEGPSSTPPPTPSVTASVTSSAAPTSSTSAATSSVATTGGATTLSADEARSVVWPQPGSRTLYDDPVQAAATMALRLARFTSPLVGPFHQGDSRSGEVEIRPTSNGPVTTVLVRRMSDGHWYSIGAVCDDLRLESPAAGATIGSPVQVSGESTAFEGLVLVTVLRQGNPHPLGQLPVQGGANGTMAPFNGTVHFDAPDVGRPGVVMLSTDSAKDGHVWQATIVPVMLAADD